MRSNITCSGLTNPHPLLYAELQQSGMLSRPCNPEQEELTRTYRHSCTYLSLDIRQCILLKLDPIHNSVIAGDWMIFKHGAGIVAFCLANYLQVGLHVVSKKLWHGCSMGGMNQVICMILSHTLHMDSDISNHKLNCCEASSSKMSV